MTSPPYQKPDDRDYASALRTGILENERRNGLIVAFAQALRSQGVVLVLCERLAHGQYLADAIGCPFLQGNVSGEERNEAWEDLRQGRLGCAVASIIADEGVDIPNIGAIILAGGGRSSHRQWQRIGRGMRTSEGKERLIVIDMADTGKYLGRHARVRRKAYEAESAYTCADVTYAEACKWLGMEVTRAETTGGMGQ